MPDLMRISELAKAAGVSKRTGRFLARGIAQWVWSARRHHWAVAHMLAAATATTAQ